MIAEDNMDNRESEKFFQVLNDGISLRRFLAAYLIGIAAVALFFGVLLLRTGKPF